LTTTNCFTVTETWRLIWNFVVRLSKLNLDCTNGINTKKVNRTNINSQLSAITFSVHNGTVIAHNYLLNTAGSHVYNHLSEYPWFTRAPAFCHDTEKSYIKRYQVCNNKKSNFYITLDIQTFISVILYCRIGLFYDGGWGALSRSVCSVEQNWKMLMNDEHVRIWQNSWPKTPMWRGKLRHISHVDN